jgi:hypothetical protein
MLAMAQQNRLLSRTSAVLCPTQHHGVHRVIHHSSSARHAATREVRQAAATTAADFGTEAVAGQHLVSTVADPQSVMRGTPLKHAKLGNNYDAIVIGSGMGGLAAAVALTKYAGRGSGTSCVLLVGIKARVLGVSCTFRALQSATSSLRYAKSALCGNPNGPRRNHSALPAVPYCCACLLPLHLPACRSACWSSTTLLSYSTVPLLLHCTACRKCVLMLGAAIHC